MREVEGRLPTAIFGLEAAVFAGTGINGSRLWLHYNWLPANDEPGDDEAGWPAFVWLREALETCRTIDDLEALLGKIHRDGGMILFAVDGKSEAFGLFECGRSRHVRRERRADWIVGTNHPCELTSRGLRDADTAASQRRYWRLEALAGEVCGKPGGVTLPDDLIGLLADPEVEARGADFDTVYANVACPGRRAIWYTFGGYPAASTGAWRQLAWPWES